MEKGKWRMEVGGWKMEEGKGRMNDSLGESEETKLWLDFSLDCGYIQADDHRRLTAGYEQVGAMLWALMTRWESLR
jgi:four helix bundle protein